MYYAIKLNAGNDRNGNPRRGWLVYDAQPTGDPEHPTRSELVAWVEEGYAGIGALRKVYPEAHELCQLRVPYAEIRAARKFNAEMWSPK